VVGNIVSATVVLGEEDAVAIILNNEIILILKEKVLMLLFFSFHLFRFHSLTGSRPSGTV
jgi:hypothetical protein